MKPLKHITVFILAFLFTGHVYGLTFAESAHKKNKSSIYGQLGFNEGGTIIGLDYEMEIQKSHSAGGYLHMFSKKDSAGIPGGMALGGFVRLHWFKRAWDFYVSPGFGLFNYERREGAESKTSMLIGPSLGLGVKFQFTRAMAAGMQINMYNSWFGDVKGPLPLNPIMGTFQYGF